MKKVIIGLVASAAMSTGLSALADSLIDGNWGGDIGSSMGCDSTLDPVYSQGNKVVIQDLIAKPATESNGATSYQVSGGTVIVYDSQGHPNTKGQNLKGVVYYGGWNLNSINMLSDTPLAISGNYYDPTSSNPKGWMRTSLFPTGSTCEVNVALYPVSSATKKK